MLGNNAKTIDILLVEDNPTDVILMREAMLDSKFQPTLHVVEDGVEAMAYLRRQGVYAKKPLPDLIILDLNLPRKDGREVLREVKADPDLKRIPVVVISTSQAENDILSSYDLHANCYATKPVDFDQFLKMVRAIEEFWFNVVKLPPKLSV